MSNVRNFDSFINEQSYLLEMLDASSQIALNNAHSIKKRVDEQNEIINSLDNNTEIINDKISGCTDSMANTNESFNGACWLYFIIIGQIFVIYILLKIGLR